MEKMDVVERKTYDFQVWFCSFLEHNSPKECKELARKGPKFP
jgi:hypothetical protein